jgi:acetyl esterase/lipase
MQRVLWTSVLVMMTMAVAGVRADETTFRASLRETFKDQRPGDVPRELLWPAGAPGARGDTDNDKPTIDIYLPPKEKATGAAVIVLPGGGYAGLALRHEGLEVAEFFRSHGIAAFVVRYRLGSHGYRHPAMLQDAQRAVRYVRTRAAELGVRPNRIGVMGFSAGGHLASTVGTHFDAGDTSAADPVERLSCRPDFLILCYPVISLTAPFSHKGSTRNLLGDDPDPTLLTNLSHETQVTKETPPTFLFHTDQDSGVSPEHSILFYTALRQAGVGAELHIYRTGPHGVGLGTHHPLLKEWPALVINWMEGLGLLADLNK